MSTKGMSRRNFLALGSLAAVAGGAALAGCAPTKSEGKASKDDAKAAEIKTADETMECDIAIVGAGGAGMWAAVEACRAGKKSHRDRERPRRRRIQWLNSGRSIHGGIETPAGSRHRFRR